MAPSAPAGPGRGHIADRRTPLASRAVVRVRREGSTLIVPLYRTFVHGDGHDPRRRVPGSMWVATADLLRDGRASVLRAAEPESDQGWRRRVRRGAVCAVRCADGAAAPGAAPVCPAAARRIRQRPGLGAGDHMAGGRFTEPAVVSASGGGGGAARRIRRSSPGWWNSSSTPA